MKASSETEIVDYIRKRAGNRYAPSLVRSIGDDCAVVRPPAGYDLVFTTDFAIEHRHFSIDTHSGADVGHKALARSLSDLAAMGAEPLFCLVSLALSEKIASWFVPDFYRGLLALAKRHRIALAGGDLSRHDAVIADVMCCGTVPKGEAMLRSAAKPGDLIYVTGSLGASAAGLRLQKGPAWLRHRRPTPRIEAGLALRRMGVRSAMDLSDGLSLDLARLCAESKVGAVLESALLPVDKAATREEALDGGEDYELLFTCPARKKLPAKIGKLAITKIGEITARKRQSIVLDGKPMPRLGFDHFK